MNFSPRPLILVMALASFGSVAQTIDLGPDLTPMQRFQLYPRMDKAMEALSRGEGPRAISELEEAQRLAPDNVVIGIYLADAYRRFGQPKRAEAVLKEQQRRHPGDQRLTKALSNLGSATPLTPALPAPAERAAPAPAAPAPVPQGASAASPTTPAPKSNVETKPAPAKAAAPRQERKPTAARTTPRSTPSSHPAIVPPRRSVPAAPPNPGYEYADKAYAEVAKRNLAAALPFAEQAVKAAPDQLDYQRLLVYLLIENGKYDQAQMQLAQLDASSAIPASDPEWNTLRSQARQRSAYRHFEAARAAGARGDWPTALREAEQGTQDDPKTPAQRLQWIGLLLQSGDPAKAQQVAEQGLAQGDSPALQALLGAALQAQQQRNESERAFDAALSASNTTDQEQKNYRMIAADAALAAHRPERAQTLLAPLSQSDDQGITGRLAEVKTALQRPVSAGSLYTPTLRLPVVNCFGADYTVGCEVWPGQTPPDPARAVAEQAYQAYTARHYAEAAQKAQEASQLNPASLPYVLLRIQALAADGQVDAALKEAELALQKRADKGEILALRSRLHREHGHQQAATADAQAALEADNLSLASEVDMLLQLGRRDEANARLSKALEDPSLQESDDPDLGYLASRVGKDEAALKIFDRARASNRLPATSLRDGAYTAGRLGKSNQAIDYFQGAVDEANAGKLELTPQAMFSTRREIADRTRTWGANALLGYRGISPGSVGAAQPGLSGDVAQLVAEAYWRPQGFRNGSFWEIYAGMAQTVYSRSGGPTGSDTTQGAVGVRVKPLVNHSLVLSAERRFRIGSLSIDDWLLRAGYSGGMGTDLRVDVPHWTTINVYAEAGRFLELKQTYATLEAQAGRSFRIGDADSRWVLFPHAVVGVDYNSARTPAGYNGAAGAGVGVGLRYWFREDRYNAPRSYMDLSLQYRGRLAGDERGHGVFVRAAFVF